MSILEVMKNLEEFLVGQKKPKDHWKKYRKPKSNK